MKFFAHELHTAAELTTDRDSIGPALGWLGILTERFLSHGHPMVACGVLWVNCGQLESQQALGAWLLATQAGMLQLIPGRSPRTPCVVVVPSQTIVMVCLVSCKLSAGEWASACPPSAAAAVVCDFWLQLLELPLLGGAGCDGMRCPGTFAGWSIVLRGGVHVETASYARSALLHSMPLPRPLHTVVQAAPAPKESTALASEPLDCGQWLKPR